jgi:hypothetical protein
VATGTDLLGHLPAKLFRLEQDASIDGHADEFVGRGKRDFS